MEKIKDIFANTTTYGEMYNPDYQLTGRIIIKDDTTFEGIIKSDSDSFLVTGKVNEEEINMLQQELGYYRFYKAKKDNKGNRTYYGDCYIKDNELLEPVGEAMINIVDSEEYRYTNKDEIYETEEEIDRKKTTNKR